MNNSLKLSVLFLLISQLGQAAQLKTSNQSQTPAGSAITAGAIGIGTGAVTSVVDLLINHNLAEGWNLTNNKAPITLFSAITWGAEKKLREELIESSNNKKGASAAQLGSWIGYLGVFAAAVHYCGGKLP
jgi:hypothetical protein